MTKASGEALLTLGMTAACAVLAIALVCLIVRDELVPRWRRRET